MKNIPMVIDVARPKYARATKGYVSTARKQGYRTYVPRARAGFNRTSGFYGRFQGPAGELKFFDTAVSFTVDATAEVPATGQLNLIPQGVTESTRVGRKCTLKSIQINGNLFYAPGASSFGTTLVTICLVQDTQCNGAAATAADVYDLGADGLPQSLRNIENSDRFKILKRWDNKLEAAAGIQTAFNSIYKRWDFYRKLQIPIEFSATTGAITEIKSNNLFLLAGASGSDDLVTVHASCRVRYSDQ